MWPTDIVASSNSAWIRTAAVSDLEGLSEYFENLSQSSRRNRFMGAVGDVSKIAFDCLKQNWRPDHFTLVAEWRVQRRETIIGEAAYGFDREKGCGEFAISVADRWQHRGLVNSRVLYLMFVRLARMACGARRRAVYSPRSEPSLARRSSSSANSVRRRLISRSTRVSSVLACCSLT